MATHTEGTDTLDGGDQVQAMKYACVRVKYPRLSVHTPKQEHCDVRVTSMAKDYGRGNKRNSQGLASAETLLRIAEFVCADFGSDKNVYVRRLFNALSNAPPCPVVWEIGEDDPVRDIMATEGAWGRHIGMRLMKTLHRLRDKQVALRTHLLMTAYEAGVAQARRLHTVLINKRAREILEPAIGDYISGDIDVHELEVRKKDARTEAGSTVITAPWAALNRAEVAYAEATGMLADADRAECAAAEGLRKSRASAANIGQHTRDIVGADIEAYFDGVIGAAELKNRKQVAHRAAEAIKWAQAAMEPVQEARASRMANVVSCGVILKEALDAILCAPTLENARAIVSL